MSQKISIELEESAVRDYAGVKAGNWNSPIFNSLVVACKRALLPKPLTQHLASCVEMYTEGIPYETVHSKLLGRDWNSIKALIDYAEAKLKEEA